MDVDEACRPGNDADQGSQQKGQTARSALQHVVLVRRRQNQSYDV